jgi:hypothetical protein
MVTLLTWLMSVSAVLTGLWTGGPDRLVAVVLAVLVGVRYAARRRLRHAGSPFVADKVRP